MDHWRSNHFKGWRNRFFHSGIWPVAILIFFGLGHASEVHTDLEGAFLQLGDVLVLSTPLKRYRYADRWWFRITWRLPIWNENKINGSYSVREKLPFAQPTRQEFTWMKRGCRGLKFCRTNSPQAHRSADILKGFIPITGGLSVSLPIFQNDCTGRMKKGNHSRSQQHDLTFSSTEKGICGSFSSLVFQSPSDPGLHLYNLEADIGHSDVASLLQERSERSMEKLVALSAVYSSQFSAVGVWREVCRQEMRCHHCGGVSGCRNSQDIPPCDWECQGCDEMLWLALGLSKIMLVVFSDSVVSALLYFHVGEQENGCEI